MTPRPNGLNRYLQNISFNSCTMEKFFLAVYGTFSQIDHILGHKASFNKYKKSDITSCILSNHIGIKLKINSKWGG
jgi:hypothetical protein